MSLHNHDPLTETDVEMIRNALTETDVEMIRNALPVGRQKVSTPETTTDALSTYANSDIGLSSDIPPITKWETNDEPKWHPRTEVIPMDEEPFKPLPKPWSKMTPEEAAEWGASVGPVNLPLHVLERQSWFPDVEYGELPENTEWLSLAKSEIPQAVKDYVKLVETGETTKWCKCPWAVHPDHKDIPAEHCVACGEHKTNQCHVDGPIVLAEEAEKGWHHFKGRGVRRMDTNPICPVHTREGLILGLFEHLFGEDDENTPV